MQIELSGTIKVIFDEKYITDNFSKKELVVTIEGDTQYPQDIIIQATNSKIDKIKDINVGDTVLVKCQLRGNGTKDGRYFNQLTLWEIEVKK